MTTLFISDLHLDPARPGITALFLAFLRGEARRGEALYILGDLFESWVGDDDDSELAAEVAAGLAGLSGSGVPVAFQHGNRDFLLGTDYATRSGLRLMAEHEVVDLYGRPTLLLHGDQLCTQDHAYQRVRRQLRDPSWQRQFLDQSLEVRRQFAAQAREASRVHQMGVSSEVILDVDPAAVTDAFRDHGVRAMIHGHTHRPAVHIVHTDQGECERIVLGDWYEQGSVLRVDRDGINLSRLDV